MTVLRQGQEPQGGQNINVNSCMVMNIALNGNQRCLCACGEINLLIERPVGTHEQRDSYS
jgi:hypothetical protein